MNDPIADLLTRLRNAIHAGHEKTDLPASRQREAILSLLTEEGYLAGYKVLEGEGHRRLRVHLKYDAQGDSVIGGLSRVSKAGRRVYRRSSEIPPVLGGLGVSVISTSKGLLTDRKAREQKLGGEVLFNVW
jgi:small subunit ribosomal protein S8